MRNFIEDEFQSVEIPESLHERCCLGIQKAEGEQLMKYRKTWIKRMSAAAAALAVCVVVFNSSAIADTVKGTFRDIVRFDGAVTGTAYEVGVDEVDINCHDVRIEENTMEIKFEITISEFEEPPFAFVEYLQIGDVKILDNEGHLMDEIAYAPDLTMSSPIENGKAVICLNIRGEEIVNCQKPTFKIQTLYGHSKADAPLEIRGDWEIK